MLQLVRLTSRNKNEYVNSLMPTYNQNQKIELPVKISKPKPKPLVRIPLNGPMKLGICLDASISMLGLKDSVIAGFNSLVAEQKPDTCFNLNLLKI